MNQRINSRIRCDNIYRKRFFSLSLSKINDRTNFFFVQTAWISPNEEQFDALKNFLNKRLDEGHGETILEIGTGGKILNEEMMNRR